MFFLAFFVAKHYFTKDKDQFEKFPFVVVVLALTITSLCVFLVPVDTFNVSTMTDPATGMLYPDLSIEGAASRGTVVKIMYYVLYGVLFVFAFGVVPFAYFFYEEGDSETTFRQRLRRSLLFTSFFLLFVLIILVVGLFFRPAPDDFSKKSASDWINRLFDTRNAGDGAILFCLAILTLVGLVIWCTYTAFGLAILPVKLLRFNGRSTMTDDEIQRQLIINREQARAIETKYDRSERRTRQDIKAYYQTRKRERELQAAADDRIQSGSKCEACWNEFMMPFRVVFGILSALFTLLLVISVVLTSLDKALNQWAGWMTDRPKIPNPIDITLVALAKVFPLDYVFLGILILYVFLASLVGFTHIGIRFLWIKLFSIKKHKSQPQGLLLMAALMMFVMLSLNVEFSTFAPQYTTFGSQVSFDYVNGTKSATATACSLTHITNETCIMTQLGTMYSRINLSMSFFGTVFFFSNFVFVAAVLGGIPIALCCCQKKRGGRSKSAGEDAAEEDAAMEENV
ncbi:putative serine/threonine protein kinase [Paratrimastix pyriformis]|uniref:Serine/threonine protein kinase n=1 Tax=Paratrimastix pyriformis TaxID=342808 RepID=A0ABQ8UIB9_9EUKA|nr:putative serine/threonine protein kinase [Paratrimastix pyriformis]